MRNAFEAWAQRDGHIVRRREDKPDEYLVYETQRRWVIWQAALAHGTRAAEEAPSKFVAQPAASSAGNHARAVAPAGQPVVDEAAMRNRVLNEVLDAFSALDKNAGIEGVFEVIQRLKKKQQALEEEKS
jgi:hypothetical protein